MKLTVYKSVSADYLLVPDCVRASREADRLHGPLVHCGEIESDEYSLPDLWAEVGAQIDARLYAVVDHEVALGLLPLCGDMGWPRAGDERGTGGIPAS